MVQHQTAADEGTDEEVGEVGEIPAAPEDQFSAAGSRDVVLNDHRQVGYGVHLRRNIEIAPGFHFLRRCADLLEPVPQFERRGHADTDHAFALLDIELFHQRVQALRRKGHDAFGKRVGKGLAQLFADAADEVGQHQVGASASDLQADGIDGIGVERHGNGRLADASADRFTTDKQLVPLERPHDHRHGLR